MSYGRQSEVNYERKHVRMKYTYCLDRLVLRIIATSFLGLDGQVSRCDEVRGLLTQL